MRGHRRRAERSRMISPEIEQAMEYDDLEALGRLVAEAGEPIDVPTYLERVITCMPTAARGQKNLHAMLALLHAKGNGVDHYLTMTDAAKARVKGIHAACLARMAESAKASPDGEAHHELLSVERLARSVVENTEVRIDQRYRKANKGKTRRGRG